MCFGGIENARMLLIFNEKYNNKIGNQGDNVGRYFMEHPIARASYLFAKDEERFKLYRKAHPFDSKIVLGFFELHKDTLSKFKINNVRMPLQGTDNYTISEGISSYHIISDQISNFELPDRFGAHLYNVISDVDMVIAFAVDKQLQAAVIVVTPARTHSVVGPDTVRAIVPGEFEHALLEVSFDVPLESITGMNGVAYPTRCTGAITLAAT